MNSRAFCLELAYAESEEKVISILKDAEYWEDYSSWRTYGDQESNWSIVGNQQDSAEGALVEKITNAVDALILRECWRRNIDPESNRDVPLNLTDAVSSYFDIHGGNLESAWDSEIRKLSDLISVVASGDKKTPCIRIIDKGIGQTPLRFPDTLMSLLRGNKNKIRFVQGQYNMGATGAISFCGEHGFQLVISRRDPKVVEVETKRAKEKGGILDSTRHDWGFTITRVFPPEQGEKLEVLRYLAPGGQVLTFSGGPIPILPEKYPNVYGKNLLWGTCIKLYDYHSLGRLSTDICRNLIRRLDFLLFGVALPVRFHERRSYRKDHYEAPLNGLSVVLSRNRSQNLEGDFPVSETLSIDGKPVDFLIYVFKEKTELPYATREGVAFLLNGQVQGWLPRFLFAKAELAYIEDHLLVVADTSRLHPRIRSKMFMGSRDRLKKNELTMQLEKEIVKMLKEQEEVVRINTERRKKQIENIREVNTAVLEQIQKLAKFDPSLKLLLNPGLKLHIPFDSRESQADIHYEGLEFPTYFVLESKSRRSMPKNHEARIFFKTDVANDYFFRLDPARKGYSNLELISTNEYRSIPFHKMGLSNGRAILRFRLPDSVQIGESLDFRVRVFDQTHELPPVEFTVDVLAPQAPKKGGRDSRRKPPKDEAGDESEQTDEMGPPKLIPVFQNEWTDAKWPEHWTEFCALRARASGEGGYDVYVNMDNFFLKQQIKLRKRKLPEELRYHWESGMTLITMAVLSRDKRIGIKIGETNNDNIRPEIVLKELSKALAPTILPLMNDF